MNCSEANTLSLLRHVGIITFFFFFFAPPYLFISHNTALKMMLVNY